MYSDVMAAYRKITLQPKLGTKKVVREKRNPNVWIVEENGQLVRYILGSPEKPKTIIIDLGKQLLWGTLKVAAAAILLFGGASQVVSYR